LKVRHGPAHRASGGSGHLLTRAADVVRVALLCSIVGWLVAGDGSAALKALLVLPPALLGRPVRIEPAFDLLFASALSVEATATGLGAYDSIGWGDTLSHLVLPLLSGPVLYAGLLRLDAVPTSPTGRSPRFLLGAAVVTGASVLAVGALWELVEWAADGAFGTSYSQGSRDTMGDLVADAIAAVGAGALVAAWLRHRAGELVSRSEFSPRPGRRRPPRAASPRP
jgi:hypothetical protein